MNNIMKPYIDLGKCILNDSENCDDRTGAGTWSTFGHLLEFDTRLGTAFLTERKLPLRSVAGELAWFVEGSSGVAVLHDQYKCSFWNEWGSPVTGTIGPMYGKQWRDSNGVDQLKDMMESAIITPNSRRLLVNTWIPSLLPDERQTPASNPEKGKMALAPCHFAFQIRLYDDSNDKCVKWVDLMFHLRSSDYFLGLPNNIASYQMLLSMIAAHLTARTGVTHKTRWLKATLGDVHIYKNHVDACRELFTREPSKITPEYHGQDVAFNYLLSSNRPELDDGGQTRGDILKHLHKGVHNYVPGPPIEGARNV